jgi:hypothetical protein
MALFTVVSGVLLTGALSSSAAASSVSLSSAPNPSAYQGVATFTAVVTGVAPTGSVTFLQDTSPLCPPVAVAADGTATCTQMFAELGSYTITAAYSGDANNGSSTSAPIIQQVDRAPGFSFVWADCRDPPVEGHPYRFMATALGWGSMNFATTTGQTLCSATPPEEGLWVCTVSSFGTSGAQPLQEVDVIAEYSGDLTYMPSVSAPLSVAVLGNSESIFRSHFDSFDQICPVPSPIGP